MLKPAEAGAGRITSKQHKALGVKEGALTQPTLYKQR